MGWPHEIARLWLNAGAAWIAVGSSSAAPEWISVPEGQQTRRVWRTTAQETWPELLYWSGLLALAAAGACLLEVVVTGSSSSGNPDATTTRSYCRASDDAERRTEVELPGFGPQHVQNE